MKNRTKQGEDCKGKLTWVGTVPVHDLRVMRV
jgi:hypothetical protein